MYGKLIRIFGTNQARRIDPPSSGGQQKGLFYMGTGAIVSTSKRRKRIKSGPGERGS